MKKPDEKDGDGDAQATPLDPNDPILSQLRTVYDDVAAEPLPTELLDLLQKLDEAERNR